MQINVSSTTESVIDNLVSVGIFKSPEEVVERAVALVDLKRKIDEGLLDIAEGRVAPLDMDAIKQEVIDKSAREPTH